MMARFMILWRRAGEDEHTTHVSADEAAVALGLLVCGAELNDQRTEFTVSCTIPDGDSEESDVDFLAGLLRPAQRRG
jgi:hypothetical protein